MMISFLIVLFNIICFAEKHYEVFWKKSFKNIDLYIVNRSQEFSDSQDLNIMFKVSLSDKFLTVYDKNNSCLMKDVIHTSYNKDKKYVEFKTIKNNYSVLTDQNFSQLKWIIPTKYLGFYSKNSNLKKPFLLEDTFFYYLTLKDEIIFEHSNKILSSKDSDLFYLNRQNYEQTLFKEGASNSVVYFVKKEESLDRILALGILSAIQHSGYGLDIAQNFVRLKNLAYLVNKQNILLGGFISLLAYKFYYFINNLINRTIPTMSDRWKKSALKKSPSDVSSFMSDRWKKSALKKAPNDECPVCLFPLLDNNENDDLDNNENDSILLVINCEKCSVLPMYHKSCHDKYVKSVNKRHLMCLQCRNPEIDLNKIFFKEAKPSDFQDE